MVGVVIGSYQLVRKLGEGGMGAVYLGQHTLLGRRAAIKVLLPALSARPDIVNRFFNEARAVTSISDPGIVQVFDFGYHTDGSAFIVMEYLEGEPLDGRLARLGRFSAYEALRLTRQIASSLAAAHAQHIIHRDLKPENIFLVRDHEVASGERTKILDFGIAKLADDHPGKMKTNAGALMGTPVYMSPEQCRGLAEIDHRSDIYSLGCVQFQLLTGRPPFEGEGMGDIISAHIREPAPAPSSRVAGVPPEVDALVLRCLAKAPVDRFQSMAELAAAIGHLLSQVPVEAAMPYGPGGEHIAHGSMPPAYSSRPPTPAPPTPAPWTPAPPTPAPPMPTPAPPGYTVPTTLGASSGQVASSSRSPRIGRWIAGVLVVGAVGGGIAIIGTRNDGNLRVAAHDPGSASPTAPPTTPPGTPNAGAPSTTDASTAVAAEPPAPAPAPTPPPPAAAPPVDAAAPELVAEPAPPVTTPPAHTSAKKPSKSSKSHDPDHARQAVAPPATPSAVTTAAPSHASSAESPPEPAASKSTTRGAPATSRPAAGTSSALKCSKADFAAVYEAAVPPPGAVRAALKNLKACRDAGAISDADFDRYQSALVAKL